MSKKIYRECKKTYHLPVEKDGLNKALEELKKDHPEVFRIDETGEEYCCIMKYSSRSGYYVMKNPLKDQINRKQFEYQNLIINLTIGYREDKTLFDRMKSDYKNIASDPECSVKHPRFYNKLKSIPNFLEGLIDNVDKIKRVVERKIEDEDDFLNLATELLGRIEEKKDS